MTKPSLPKAAPVTTASQRLRERLDEPVGDPATDARLRSLVDFWARLRHVFAANDASMGLEALDEVAAATILQDDALPAKLTQTVVLLVNPDAMHPGHAAENEAFAPSVAPARPKRSNKRSPLRSTKLSLAKKQRKAGPLPFGVPPDTPAEIVKDLRRMEKYAAAKGKTPSQLAYPWSGKRAWYDPQERKNLYLSHWRFYVKFRSVFFLLALYAPSSDSAGRRKQKVKAIKVRLQFLSQNIEEFGWFGFLDLFENTIHDSLMWLGGKPAKHSKSAKTKANEGPPAGDLVALWRDDPEQYDRKIARSLDPRRVDEDGYSSIPELLEQTHALDCSRDPHLWLSDRALARIVIDVESKTAHRASWVGNRDEGPWRELLSTRALDKVRHEVEALLKNGKSVAVYRRRTIKASERPSTTRITWIKALA